MATNIQGEGDIEALREALIGRSVVSVRIDPEKSIDYNEGPVGEVTLDNGDVLLLVGNTGGCSCGAGDYDLTHLNDKPVNGITNVEVVVDGETDEYGEGEQTYRLFVLAFDGGRSELATFEGDDGNGYYGTGFYMEIVKP